MSNSSIIKPIHTTAMGMLGTTGLNLHLEQDLMLLECSVAGTAYRELEEDKNALKVGSKCSLKRQAKNEHDDWAVELLLEENKQSIGWLPRHKNQTVARLLDAGKKCWAVITLVDWQGSSPYLRVEVFGKL